MTVTGMIAWPTLELAPGPVSANARQRRGQGTVGLAPFAAVSFAFRGDVQKAGHEATARMSARNDKKEVNG